jgi:hypothetical protein
MNTSMYNDTLFPLKSESSLFCDPNYPRSICADIIFFKPALLPLYYFTFNDTKQLIITLSTMLVMQIASTTLAQHSPCPYTLSNSPQPLTLDTSSNCASKCIQVIFNSLALILTLTFYSYLAYFLEIFLHGNTYPNCR